jgi:hypothetical protein
VAVTRGERQRQRDRQVAVTRLGNQFQNKSAQKNY